MRSWSSSHGRTEKSAPLGGARPDRIRRRGSDRPVNGVAYPDLSETVNYLIDSANPTGYSQIIEERDGGGTVLKSCAIGDDVLSQSTHSSFLLSPSYFLCDGHGSTRRLTASEVKSGRAPLAHPGAAAFAQAFKPHRCLLAGGDGIALEDFLSQPVQHWIIQGTGV